MKITIDHEFKSLIPPLEDEEYEQLEANLKKEGCRDPLVTWEGIIVDGHNRHEICTRNGIGFECVRKQFSDRSEAIEWLIRNQFGRRNLNAYARTKLVLRLEATIAERAKAKQEKSGGPLPQKSAEPPIETREELAKLAGVSHDTVSKVKKIEAEGSAELKAKLAKDEISINKAAKEISKANEPEPTPPKNPGKWKPDDADRLWLLAKIDLDKILKSDLSRERVLREVIQYAQNRIDTNK